MQNKSICSIYILSIYYNRIYENQKKMQQNRKNLLSLESYMGL